MARLCKYCKTVIDEKDGIGTCPFCGAVWDLSTYEDDGKLVKEEPLFVEEPGKAEDEFVDTEIRDINLSFTCPRCSTILDGSPERCPECGIKLKYIAVEDIEETTEEVEAPVEETPDEVIEEDIEPTLDEPWPEDNVVYSDITIIKNNRIVSISRILNDDEQFYLVMYRDGSKNILSAKALKLQGLMKNKQKGLDYGIH